MRNRTLKKTDAIQLELFTNRFRAIAEEMGEMLRRTAISTNVKERLDFSCTLLDADGELVANAPHMPVHLGAMGICVRSITRLRKLSPGDVIITNHPAFGGSHLPDVSMVTPVFSEENQLLGYVANRAHHAEIGGSTPGSMPPFAKSLAEEGVVIAPLRLVQKGAAHWDALKMLLTGGIYPTRALEDNLADLRAALAANYRGADALRLLARKHGTSLVKNYMQALKELAERQVRASIRQLPDGVYKAREQLDDGATLKVEIRIHNDELDIDFSDSADVHHGNLNATIAIVHSVVIYVMRLLVQEPLPLNEGLMKPVTLLIPKGILNPDFPEEAALAPAVVGGNVETSQKLVNLFLKAFELSAGSQGTMNNTLFGNREFGYYETVCGGCGAGSDFDGASAVHSHMTNTRITDPEILELRYPVRLERFAIRRGSGGAGKHVGGDGVIREMTFLEPLSLSILSQQRRNGPFGLKGGKPGLPGRQHLIRKSGDRIELKSIDGCEVEAGDRFVLETPGGGGFGRPI